MLGALMLAVAAICTLAGTWQVHRLAEKRSANHLLRTNAEDPAEAVDAALGRVGDADGGRRAGAAQFRTVTAAGNYDASGQLLVRQRTVDGTVGYLVLTPLRPASASGAVLLVVRGFVAADNGAAPPIAPPPAGPVTLQGRVQPPEGDDGFGREPVGQVTAVDPAAASGRLGAPVFDGYVELLAGQPGSSGVTPMPAPDLANPAGGAVEPQHLAYIVQWYLFALLALAAPLVMARADSRRDTPTTASLDEFADPDLVVSPAQTLEDRVAAARQARLADRYGSVRRT